LNRKKNCSFITKEIKSVEEIELIQK